MSNINFTNIENTLVNAATVSNSSSVSELSQLAVQGTAPIAGLLTITNTDLVLTDTQLLQAATRGGLLLDTSGLDNLRYLSVGADTPYNAKRLQDLFGLTTVGDSVTLKFPLNTTQAGFQLGLGSSSETSTYVGFVIAGVERTIAQTLILTGSTPTNLARVQVMAESVDYGAESIVFNILR